MMEWNGLQRSIARGLDARAWLTDGVPGRLENFPAGHARHVVISIAPSVVE